MTINEYNECVKLYADSLYRFILKNVRDEDKARDIIQDTYEKLWLKVSDMPSSNAKSYMFTTAYRTMIDGFRRNQKIAEDSRIPEKAVYQSHSYHLKEVIEEALQKLPEIQRSVLMLRDYEGYAYDEIGKITGLNESQVKVYIYRARTSMKDYLVSLENVL